MLQDQLQEESKNPGSSAVLLSDKVENESSLNKCGKALKKSATDGNNDQIRTAIKWLTEKQDFGMLGEDCKKIYRALQQGEGLIVGHEAELQDRHEHQLILVDRRFGDYKRQPQTPQHLAVYAHNMLLQVRVALHTMKQLKQREHKVHQKSEMLVPLAKWKSIREKQPWLHPTFNSALAVTIDERFSGLVELK